MCSSDLNNQTTSNKLTSITGTGPEAYSYDLSGNTTAIAAKTLAYDARARLTTHTSGTTVTSFSINAIAQRLVKAGATAALTTRFVYGEDGGVASGQKLLGEYDNAGALITEHVYLNDTPIAAIKTAGGYVVQADHLNSPRAVLGAGNVSAWTWDSDAFGTTAANEKPSTLATFNYNLRFPGQYYDKETLTHYNYFRDYNPKTGRYIESDPIGLKGGINTYAYVGGNPLMYYDPYGLEALGDCVAKNRWDWGKFGPAGNDGLSNTGATVTSANLANTTANVAVGRTGAGAGTASHSTSWEHRVGSKIGQSAQFAENGRRFGSTQAAWSSAGKLIGRALIFPLIFDGFYDIGTIGRCSCTSD